MKKPRLEVDPRLGDIMLAHIEAHNAISSHIIIIAYPMDGEKLGEPTFVSSLSPPDMENALMQTAGAIAVNNEKEYVKGPKQ